MGLGWGGWLCNFKKHIEPYTFLYVGNKKSYPKSFFLSFCLSLSVFFFFFFLLSGVRTLAGRDYIKDVEVGVAI